MISEIFVRGVIMRRTIDSLAFMNYVKYDRLNELIRYAYVGSNATKINIYVDLYPIIRSIYADTYQVSYNGFMDLVPLIINICAHYRYFFRKGYGVESTIYLVAGRNHPELSTMIILEYNYGMRKREQGPTHSVMDDMLASNLQILEIMCPYLPDIHFINSAFETSVAIAYIIDNQYDKSIPNLVISKDLYPIQLVAQYVNTSFLHPCKSNDGTMSEDISVILKSTIDEESCRDFWKFILTSHKINTDIIDKASIHPINFSTTLAFSGMSERSIKSLMHLPTIMNYIHQIIGNSSTQCSIDTIFETFGLDSKISRQNIKDKFHVLDVPYQVESVYRSSNEAILQKFENKVDPIAVKAICDKYFNNIPINLERL